MGRVLSSRFPVLSSQFSAGQFSAIQCSIAGVLCFGECGPIFGCRGPYFENARLFAGFGGGTSFGWRRTAA
jgi:hypothetical protein